MVLTQPEILVRQQLDAGLLWTVLASALLHVAGVMLLLVVPPRFFRAPMGPVAYTVELVGTRELGGANLTPGRGEKGPQAAAASRAVPLPPAPAVKPPAATTAEVATTEKQTKPEPAKRSETVPDPPRPAAQKPSEPKPAPKPVAAPKHEPPPAPPVAKAKAPVEKAKVAPAEALGKVAPETARKPPPQLAPKPQAEPAKKPAAPAPARAEPPAAGKPQTSARAATAPSGETKPAPVAAAVADEEARLRDRQIEAAVQRRALDQQIAAAIQRRVAAVGQRSGGAGASGGDGQGGGPLSHGPGQGTGGIVAGAEFIAFYHAMMNRVKVSWVWAGNNQSMEAVVYFSVTATGEIVDVKTVRSSGDPTYDLSVERAVRGANPLSPPPEQYRGLFAQGVEITFRPEDLRS